MKDDLFKALNPVQKEAVLYFNSPLLIVAGAGSGKTKVITYKIAHLMQKKNYSPRHILGVTFTNRAAEEMKSRVEALTGVKSHLFNISTFHSLGLQILRESASTAGFDREWQVIDDRDQKKTLGRLIKENFNYFSRDMREAVMRKINFAKMNLNYPNNKEFLYQKGFSEDEVEIYNLYYSYQKEAKLWDYEDLVSLPVKLLQTNKKIQEKYIKKFQYVLVDEFQDTNPNQYELITLIAGHHKNITVVGDDDQAVYSWRGASIRFLFNFEEDFPGTYIIKLEQNYRSTQQILDFANNLIKKNRYRRPKALWTEKREGNPVSILTTSSREEEAERISHFIRHLKVENPEMFPVAILYRINSQSLGFEVEFAKQSIDFKILKGLRFFDRKEIKDSLSLLKLAMNFNDDNSFLRVVDFLPVGIGNKTLNSLTKYSKEKNLSLFQSLKSLTPEKFASGDIFICIQNLFEEKDNLKLSDMQDILLKRSGYRQFLEKQQEQSRLLNIDELLKFLKKWDTNNPGGNFSQLLDHITLDSGEKNTKKTGHHSVFLLTMHNAKGLEFPTVIIAGANDSYLPFFLSRGRNEIEEERRLFYVAATRAIKQLVISTGGEIPSRFISEIDQALYSKAISVNDLLGQSFQDKSANTVQSGVSQGSIEEKFLEHPVFGRGKIINALDNNIYIVAFAEKGEKTIDTSIVPVTFL